MCFLPFLVQTDVEYPRFAFALRGGKMHLPRRNEKFTCILQRFFIAPYFHQ